MPVTGPFPPVQVQQNTAHGLLQEAIEKHDGDQVAMIDTSTKISYTFREVRALAASVSRGLVHYGCRKGDIVMMVSPNSADCALLALALFPLGAILSGVNPLSTPEELSKYFVECKNQFVLTVPQLLPVIRTAVRQQRHRVKQIFVSGLQSTTNEEGILPFHSLLKFTSSAIPLPHVEISPKKDVCIILFSSGTTGPPKGVMLSHWNFVFEMETALSQSFAPLILKNDNVLAMLPFFHIFGLYMLYLAFRYGATSVIFPRYEPTSFLQAIEKYKISYLGAVPPILTFLAKDPMVTKYDISSIKRMLCGAAPCGKELLLSVAKRLPQLSYFCQAYGMTEHGGATLLLPPNAPPDKFGSCGVVVPNCELKVVDIETGCELGANKTGELWARSEAVMIGYLHRGAETAAIVDESGWLHTGDIGYYDDDKYFYIVDRLKELIKVKGFQVAPAELEDLLLCHPAVQDAAVIGVPDEQSGEIPKAFVVLKSGQTATELEIANFVAGKVSKYKQLSGGIEFCESIPKLPSGKILRRALRQRAQHSRVAKL